MMGGRAVILPSEALGAATEHPSLVSKPPLRVAETS